MFHMISERGKYWHWLILQSLEVLLSPSNGMQKKYTVPKVDDSYTSSAINALANLVPVITRCVTH